MSKNNNEFKKISEKNSKSSSFRSSGSCHKKENKMLLFTKSNQSSSNSEELLEMQRKIKRETDSNEFSSDSFKSVSRFCLQRNELKSFKIKYKGNLWEYFEMEIRRFNRFRIVCSSLPRDGLQHRQNFRCEKI